MKLFHKPDFQISAQGLSDVQQLSIGGVQQSILIQTEKPGSPILLFLHGGPSMPIPGVSNRGTDYALVMTTKQLIQHFTLVFWDQRGTGKSYSHQIALETMNLKQYINDAAEVTNYLRQQFKQDKIHLAAHSWGTVIGMYLAHQFPEKYYSYTAFSQIINWAENDKLSYHWLLAQAKWSNHKKAILELTEAGEPPYINDFKQWSVIRKWQFQYKTMLNDEGDKHSPTMLSSLKIMLASPDYSLKDIYNSLVKGFKLAYSEQLLQDIQTFDFYSEVQSLQIPVLFIHGSKEKHIFPEPLIRYYEHLEAPKGKSLHWSYKSSHLFHIDDAKENEQVLIEHLLNIE